MDISVVQLHVQQPFVGVYHFFEGYRSGGMEDEGGVCIIIFEQSCEGFF